MLEKTRGIVLHSLKYSDSGIVVHLYTRKFGRQSVLIKGMRNKKMGKHNIMFQSMFALNIEMYYKPSREMQMLKEFSLTEPFYSIQNDIRKSSVAIFLGEVLSSVLGEETPHEELFDFIENSISWFDRSESGFSNFHLSFLAHLTRFLGIKPSMPENDGKFFFDMRNGRFQPVPPFHGDYANDTSSSYISMLLKHPVEESGSISLTGRQRNEILEILVKYYSFHLPSLKKINSLEVLKEIFG